MTLRRVVLEGKKSMKRPDFPDHAAMLEECRGTVHVGVHLRHRDLLFRPCKRFRLLPMPLVRPCWPPSATAFQQYKTLADRALAQLTRRRMAVLPGARQQRAAVIVQHLVGNLRSRFTDFLTSDGEKPTRQRDQEFEEPTSAAGMPALQQEWEAAWRILFDLLESLRRPICCAPSPFGARRTPCWRPCSAR